MVPSFRRWAAPRPPDLTEYACIRRNRVGGGTARPTALERPVNGSKSASGAARSAYSARTRLLTKTTRPRGACPLTGRDRDVGRTNQTKKSLKEVSGLKASRSSAQSVCQSGPCTAAWATISLLVQSDCAPPLRGGAGPQSSTPAFRLPSGSSHLRTSAQSKQIQVPLPFTTTGARKMTGFDAPHLWHVIGGRIAGLLMPLPLSIALRPQGQNRLPSAPRTPREKSPACLL